MLTSWFESFRKPGSTDYDFQKHIDTPFKLLKDGYIGVNDIATGKGGSRSPRPTTSTRALARRKAAAASVLRRPPVLRTRSRVRFTGPRA